MRRLILKSVFPTIQEAKDAVLFNQYYVEVERGWMFFDTKSELEGWIDMDVNDERGPF